MSSEGNCQNILTSHIISTKDDNSDGKESKEPDYDGDKDRQKWAGEKQKR
jgi:hypothetical protein